ncbi:MAG: response regulator [Spirochaetes bacterium]|nr:response regulator [Spirochaetota bacterium]
MENISILIVENDKTVSDLINVHFQEMGLSTVRVATKSDEALSLIAEMKPDLILMDVSLAGGIDGIETARRINSTNDIPIIFISSSTDRETIDRVRTSNPFGYIVKPVDKNELKSAVDMALLRYSMDKKLRNSEQKLSTILNSIVDAVIVTDINGYINYMNPVAEEMTECRLENCQTRINDIVNIENTAIKIMKGNHSIPLDQGQSYNYLITKSGRRIPVEYSVAPQKDRLGAFVGTVMVIRDITERVKSEEMVMEGINLLRKTMGGMIQAIAYTIETRDPYTAGHQRRVSDLAREIAKTMGLTRFSIEGIRLAGVIHDLGKISVPAEILSKPGRLTEIEFSLIKIHPQIGYEIIKPIDFPWPVADIIYQHHERVDGSGYPRGLTGGEIMIEAKILAVADVVEAMASHRPYRASLGIDLALEEISSNRGSHYEGDVVDTCIDLFTNRGYVMNQS